MKRANRYKVVSNEKIADNMYLMGIDSQAIADRARPGQFLHIKVPKDNSRLLRRPISINYIDIDRGIVYIAYQVVGEGTRILSLINREDELDILGPLGNGFFIPKEVDRVILVGGGCGIAPLRYIPSFWKDISYTTFLGYRNKKSIYQLEAFNSISDRVFLTTDDGSYGEMGFITDLLRRELSSIRSQLIMACGPINMLSQVQAISKEYSIPCQISLEERMGCGIGACMVCSCAIELRDGFEYKKICSDGPVFWSNEVILDGKNRSSR